MLSRPSGRPSTLENYLQVTASLATGGAPKRSIAYKDLAAQGFKTLVSVDGKQPNVPAARQYGLNYIHIPIGYDRLSPDALSKIAKVAETSEGPIYLHCHHGRHRAPAAAAILLLADNRIGKTRAISILEAGGTDPLYTGLWDSVKEFDAAKLDIPQVTLEESADVDPFVEAMVEMDLATEALELAVADSKTRRKGVREKGLEPILQRILDGISDSKRFARDRSDPDFIAELTSNADAILGLKDQLSTHANPINQEQISQLKGRCQSCHRRYR